MLLQVERRRLDVERHTWRHPKVREDLSPRRQIYGVREVGLLNQSCFYLILLLIFLLVLLLVCITFFYSFADIKV